MAGNINDLLRNDADYHQRKTILKEQFHTPGPDFIDKILLRPIISPLSVAVFSYSSFLFLLKP
jgi:hypothetical protein